MENRKLITVKLPPDLLKEIEAYRNRQPAPPSRTAVIEGAVRQLLQKEKRRSS